MARLDQHRYHPPVDALLIAADAARALLEADADASVRDTVREAIGDLDVLQEAVDRLEVGYARVSTADQDLSLQLEALRHAGCQDAWIFRDITSGTRTARPGLEACLHALGPGDTLVVWRLDRLGRSMTHLVTVIEELLSRQVGFRALCDGAIDTTTVIFTRRVQQARMGFPKACIVPESLAR